MTLTNIINLELFVKVVLAILQALLIFLLTAYITRRDKKREAKADKRSRERSRENFLMLNSLLCISDLSYATAIAIKEGKVNGIMDHAMLRHNECSLELKTFIRERATEGGKDEN